MTTKVAAPRARKSFSRLEARPRPPQPDRHPEGVVRVVPRTKASARRSTTSRRSRTTPARSPSSSASTSFGEPPVLDQGVPREGPDLPGPALDDRPLRQQGHGRDPRADGLHGRLPDDDGVGHVHHQRHRARDRHAARPLAGRLPDGAEGPDEAGLHGEPDAEPRLVARARDRQEGRRLRPHRPEAQAADHDAPARAAGRGPDDRLPARHVVERGDPRAVRQLALTSSTRSRRTRRRARKRR